MNAPERCPKCNGPLTPTTGQPMCPACLMRGVLQPSDSEIAGELLTETRSLADSGKWDSMRSIGATTALQELEPETDFGDYRIVRRLGHGGMGVVYEADHLPTSRRVALKVLAQSLDQPDARARFLREGRLAASINHPNSVYVYGTEEIEDVPTITMELVDGGTLAQQIKTNGPMSIRAAVDAVIQIIDGLAAADERGVLHRDVKPSNCFVAADGTVKVGDFGLSISTTGGHLNSMSDVTIEGTFLGTPAFASPEQLRGEPLDRRSDIYSVGVTLFYLLTGRVPFDADNMIHLLATVLDKPAPSVCAIRADVPDELNSVITKCLQKPAGGRYENYDSLRYALKPFSSESPIAASPGNRTVAGVVDAAICWAALSPLMFAVQVQSGLGTNLGVKPGPRSILMSIFSLALIMAYYAISEWRYGCTIGKWLLGLRVASGDRRPRLAAAVGRAFLWIGVPAIPSMLFNLFYLSRDATDLYAGPVAISAIAVGGTYYVLKYGLFVTMREKSGYTAIHDRLTGTRVLERSADLKPVASGKDSDAFEFAPDAAKIGPYYRLQTLFDHGAEQLLLGYDAKLLRRVWIHLQPVGTPGISLQRRQSGSPACLRWLGQRRSESECWDCYEAPSGQSLSSLCGSVGGMRSVQIMRRLVQLIQDVSKTTVTTSPTVTDSDEDRQVHEVKSLEHLWVTDLDEVKRLPIAIPAEHEDRNRQTDVSQPSGNASVNLIRKAATCLLDSADASGSACQSWSLGSRDAMKRVANAESVVAAQAILNDVQQGRSMRLRTRVLAMQAAALLFPLSTALFGLLGLFLYNYQQAQYPEIEQLYEIAQVIDHEESQFTPDYRERSIAIKRYLTGNYADTLNDKEVMNSLYAIVRLNPADRIALQQAVTAKKPTAEELHAATQRYESIRQQWSETPHQRPQILFSFWTTVGPVWTLLEFVWFPSLITGMLFRGGLLMRVFGLVLVNRRAELASRLRVFLRMFFSGLPALAIAFGAVVFSISGTPIGFSNHWLPIAIMIALQCSIAATMFAVPFFRTNRCLSDQFAGTYYMVR